MSDYFKQKLDRLYDALGRKHREIELIRQEIAKTKQLAKPVEEIIEEKMAEVRADMQKDRERLNDQQT